MIKPYKSNVVILTTVFVVFSCLTLISIESSDAQNSKKNKGLKFHVPDDWPIEERGGLLGPIPTEEYMIMKFDEVDKEFSSVRDDLSVKFNDLKDNLESVKLDFSKEIKKSQSDVDGLSKQAGSGGDLTDIISRITDLENQMARLDRKITNKTTASKDKTDEVIREMNALKKKFEQLQVKIYKLDEEVDYVLQLQSQKH